MSRFLTTLLARRQDDPEPLPAPPRGAPRYLRLETGSFPIMRGVRYSVSRGTITRVQHGIRTQTSLRQPDPEEWISFWSIVDCLGLREWRNYYQAPRYPGRFTFDGPGWSFRLRTGSLYVHSSGRGRYPSITRPHESTDSAAALDTLRAELNRLIDARPLTTEPADGPLSQPQAVNPSS